MQTDQAIWQLSGGPVSRSYADVFVRYAVGLLGPGDPGPWHLERSDEDFDGSFVRRFASEMKAGDVVLLRTGLSKIRAVGVVAGDYEYLNQFDDVERLGPSARATHPLVRAAGGLRFWFVRIRRQPSAAFRRGLGRSGRLRPAVRGLASDLLARGDASGLARGRTTAGRAA